MSEILLAVLIFLPAVLTFFLKSNAAAAFLALCGGFAVITLSGSDIEHLIGHTKITSLTSNNVDLGLLLIPLFVTLILTYKTVTAKNARYFSIVPALCAGGLLAIVAAPMLSDAANVDVTSSSFWHDLQNAQTYVVSIGLLSSLLLIWTVGLGRGHHSKKHK